MENKKVVWICGILTLFAAIIFTLMVFAMRDDKKALQEANETLLKERTASTSCSFTRDSLFKVNNELSKYKELTQAMLHRDEATSHLKHKIGDVVIMKNDSARVIVEDVLIGGGKYDYYVKYRVLFKDNTTKEVKPELIY